MTSPSDQTPRTKAGPYPPTICRCGMAKSYHIGDRMKACGDYTPRYEPVAWLDGFAAGQAQARTEALDVERRCDFECPLCAQGDHISTLHRYAEPVGPQEGDMYEENGRTFRLTWVLVR